MKKLEGKTALITGASKGIGKAIALKLASEGANVAIHYHSDYQGAQNVLSETLKFNVKAITLSGDLTNEQDCDRVVSTVIKELGDLDILVNNAGGYIDGDDWNGEYSSWLKTFELNTLNVLSVSKYALRHFTSNKKGTIINIATRYSVSGQFDSPAYSAAKAAIVNITQGQAKLLSPYGSSNAISPGAVNAGYWLNAPKDELDQALEQIPTRKLIEPQEIADIALLLATNINITGQNILIDAGYNLGN